jgi:HD superfamily phosphohydrolase
MAERSFVIRDPVHGYISVAPHERIIVDHPVTQRLRNISQTGLAHLVFPEARTSRFSHSLGSMQLASEFLIACVEHADRDAVDQFFAEVENLPILKDQYLCTPPDFDLTSPEPFGGGALKAPRTRVGANLPAAVELKRRQLLSLVEAGLRLAALFHDLGHLPFSHDFEPALRTHVGQLGAGAPAALKKICGGTPHEQIGHLLAGLVFKVLIARSGPAIRASYSLAKSILDVEPPYFAQKKRPRASLLHWLHSLIDGEVDVDRADYLLRDGRALGFEFAAYDLDRLCNNLVLLHDGDLGFITAVREAGLGTVESFFLSRARSGQSLIRHHKVAQISAALQHATVAALAGSEAGRTLLSFLERLGGDPQAAGLDEAFLLEFARFDDVWWSTALRTLLDTGDPLLRACVWLVLFRKKSLVSLWKRTGDLDDEVVSRLNANATQYEELGRRIEELRGKGILVTTHRFRPYGLWPLGTDEDSIMLVKTELGHRSAAKHSPLMHSLYEAWEHDVHLHAFAMSEVDRKGARDLAISTLAWTAPAEPSAAAVAGPTPPEK